MGRITLTCWAFNLSISEAIPVWFQDEKPVQQKTFGSKTILPSGDGTYQAWVSTWALPRQEPQFTCNLKHGGYNINISAVSGEKGEQLSTSGVGSRARKSLWTAMTTAFMVISWTSSQKTGEGSTLLLLWWLLLFSTSLAVLTLA